MDRTHRLLALAAFGGVVAAALCWRIATIPATPAQTQLPEPGQATASQHGAVSRSSSDATHQGSANPPAQRDRRTTTTRESKAPGTWSEPAPRAPAQARVPWPVARGSRIADTAATSTGEPVVPAKLAFRALWYLGVDPEAEKTWSRAVNDRNLPEGVRSDLILDMVDEGYTDNNRPGKADLPLILARLEILERYRPYAMDLVNARAFDQAYRTLLDLYIRLGGEPRNPR